MNTHQERMAKLLEYLKKNPNELAKDLGYTRTDKIYNIINGRNGISTSVAKDIAEKYDINYRWILGENCDMLQPMNTNDSSLSEAQPQGDMSMEDELAHWQTLATNLQTTASSLVQIIQGMQKEKEEIIQVMRSIQEENLKLVDELRKEKVG